VLCRINGIDLPEIEIVVDRFAVLHDIIDLPIDLATSGTYSELSLQVSAKSAFSTVLTNDRMNVGVSLIVNIFRICTEKSVGLKFSAVDTSFFL
jgi:ABC-type polysaccharide/polyol phosphate transport system ATPase subunit